MLIDTSTNIHVKNLLPLLANEDKLGARVVVQHQGDQKRRKLKVSPERAEWVYGQVSSSSVISISTSTFTGRAILPNFASSRVVCVTIDVSRQKMTTSKKLLTSILASLDVQHLPHPSAVAAIPDVAFAIWIVDSPFLFEDLGDLYKIERVLSRALKGVGALQGPRSASRYIPLPSSGGAAQLPVGLLSPSSQVRTINKARLIEAVSYHLLEHDVEILRRNTQTIEELSCLFDSRLFDVAADVDKHWAWMTGYAASCGLFVDRNELGNIVRAVTESLDCDWSLIKSKEVPQCAMQYQNYLDVLINNTRAGQVKLGHYFGLEEHAWHSVLGEKLSVTDSEISNFNLRNLASLQSSKREINSYSRSKIQLGREDFVSLAEFMRTAA